VPFLRRGDCGATKTADPLIAPDGLLPAKVPKSTAQAEVQLWLATRWFAPNSLKRLAKPDGIGGIYLPFWTYDADTESHYEGERGEHYWDTEVYTETDNPGEFRAKDALRSVDALVSSRWRCCAQFSRRADCGDER
jgi:hypothetical protein